MDEGDTERMHSSLEILQARFRDSGLHVVGTLVTEVGDPHGLLGPTTLLVAVDAVLGELAFSTRVQDPDQANVDDEFRQMQVGMGNDFDATRRLLQERAERGEDPFTEEGA